MTLVSDIGGVVLLAQDTDRLSQWYVDPSRNVIGGAFTDWEGTPVGLRTRYIRDVIA